MAYDRKALDRLAEALGELASVPSRVVPTVAPKIESMLREQFDDGVDPYGEPWAPLATGDQSYLQKTGDMLSTLDVTGQRGAGIRITIDPPANFHQTGTARMPARKILPEEELPEEWSDAIDDAVADDAKKRWEAKLGGRR